MPSFSDAIYNQFYPGWGKTEAEADWKATGASKWANYQKQINPSPQDIANQTIAAAQAQIDKEKAFLDQYTADNPFIFDEELAKQSATAEYAPYYSELLEDYLSQTELERENIQSEVDLLTKLKTLDRTEKNREYQMAYEKAAQGYAGQGMFFSGLKHRGLALADIGYREGLDESQSKYATDIAGQGRNLENLGLEEEMKKRDIEREQQVAIESGILTRQSEAQKAYYAPLEQAYYRQFPTNEGVLKGYTLPSYYMS